MPTCVYYTVMNLLGFGYVNACNMNFQTATLLHSLHSTFGDFVLTLLISPVLFILSGMFVLKSEFDVADRPRKCKNVIHHNSIWCVAFLVGLQFTHLDSGIMQQFVLTLSAMQTWPVALWVFFFTIIVSILAVGILVIRQYQKAGILKIYLVLFNLIILGFAGITFLLGSSYQVHIHHYTVGMLFVVLLAY